MNNNLSQQNPNPKSANKVKTAFMNLSHICYLLFNKEVYFSIDENATHKYNVIKLSNRSPKRYEKK